MSLKNIVLFLHLMIDTMCYVQQICVHQTMQTYYCSKQRPCQAFLEDGCGSCGRDSSLHIQNVRLVPNPGVAADMFCQKKGR